MSADCCSKVKYGVALPLRERSVRGTTGVQAHSGVACWSTTAWRTDSDKASGETLRSYQRSTSSVQALLVLRGNIVGCWSAVRQPA